MLDKRFYERTERNILWCSVSGAAHALFLRYSDANWPITSYILRGLYLKNAINYDGEIFAMQQCLGRRI